MRPPFLPKEDWVFMDMRRCIPARNYIVVECRHCYHEQFAVQTFELLTEKNCSFILNHGCKKNRETPLPLRERQAHDE